MRTVRAVVVGVFALAVGVQLIPYGRHHTNPPVTQEAPWTSPDARQLAVRACYDCHSNQTIWRWYSYVAPASWLVQNHVDDGRQALNFSEWNRPQQSDELAQAVTDGSMPPRSYLLMHPAAALSSAEKQRLAAALATIAPQGAGGRD